MTGPTMNQYAAPRAEVGDMTDHAVAEMNYFSPNGRIGRLRYLAYTTGGSMIYTLVISVLTVALGVGSTLLMGVNALTVIALIVFGFICSIKRCHDMNLSGWWSLVGLIPLIALIWVIVPGSKGENRFGPPPPPNTWGVRLLGIILPVIFFVGILAAIAIPSYKSYTDKARAAQAARP